MPIFLLPLILALTSVGAQADIAAPKPATAQAESPTFDPDRPPSWWLHKMRRPCTTTGNRVSC